MNRCQDRSLAGFRRGVCEQNILSRGSESSRSKLYTELKGRYLLDDAHPLFRLFLQEWDNSVSHQEQALCAYVLFCLNDKLVFTVGCDWLFPRLSSAPAAVRVPDLENFLAALAKSDHPEIAGWSDATRKRVIQHYLASIRDFGLASGAANKFTVHPSLHSSPTRLLLRGLALAGIPVERQIHHESFKLLGIGPQSVVDALSNLNREGSIRFKMQADVIDLKI